MPPWTATFSGERDGSLTRRLSAVEAGEAAGGLVVEQTIRAVEGQSAAVVRSALRNSTDGPHTPGGTTLAAWTFRGDGSQNAGYGLMTHNEGIWYESTFWQGGENWLRVGKDWHHPGDRAPSVRRFTAPRDGTLRITGRVYKAHLAGDGVGATILHSPEGSGIFTRNGPEGAAQKSLPASFPATGIPVWRHELAGDDGEGVDPNLELTVNAGDAIRFVVDKLGAISCDTTRWDPVVTYADGQAFRASEAFGAKRQGVGNWWYEAPVADNAPAPGLARVHWFDAQWALRTKAVPVGEPLVLDHRSAQPVAVLADEQDESGVALVIDGDGPWQLEVVRSEEGSLSVRALAPSANTIAPGQTLALPAVTLGAYHGTSLAGFARVSRWMNEAKGTVPCASLQQRFEAIGVAELDYWAMIQHDWQRQDATDPARPETFTAALMTHLEKTDRLLNHLQAKHGPEKGSGAFSAQHPPGRSGKRLLTPFPAFATELAALAADTGSDPASRYLRLRILKRRISLANPLLDFGELLFAKRVPTSYSHLVMQHYGWRARPGGGLFILEEPGRSLRARDILDGKHTPEKGSGAFSAQHPSGRSGKRLLTPFPAGNVLEPRLSYDGRRIVFSYVDCPDGPLTHAAVCNDQDPSQNFYHIWEVNVDGTGLRRLTNDAYDDLMPCYLPDGGIAFMSTRRKGYARCFGGQFSTRWDVYTLHRMDGDGLNIRTLSYHDTNEWYPAVSHTGHILYARWDYIDRDAVTHQNLWASRPDGTNPIAVWGNATPNPHCTFQAQPIPGSQKILFTASAHHSITAGSIAILDPTVARDGLEAIERITPEIPFPESESRDIREYYAAPWPLSEDFYLVAYSPYPLVWEPGANRKDALGLYLLDRFGNRELIYRDPEIGSTNPIPLRPRPTPPVLASMLADNAPPVGTMVVADVSEGLGGVPRDHIKELRIVQIFAKTTNVANSPPVGLAGEENARAVLGTVPVEPDGSAHFNAPSGKLLLFQALDKDGFAYQTMRTVTYLQPGESVSCVGCHEHKMSAPVQPATNLLALGRRPSEIHPGSWGGRPFSYVEVVQPVLDKHCVTCHGGEKPKGELVLTGEPAGAFNRSYVELMSAKDLIPRFAQRNQIQVTLPGGEIGALGSRLMHMLREGHEDVALSDEELRRLALWIDLNAIFYGVHLPEDQARMLRGETVEMPEIQ
ncbi:MAG: hypothetical protein RBS80_10315 [Thermoguttaceae bacterium]|jgi:hypothetical protein|nr:hypothetical protein [Thermoguttaceae bacterium]